MDSPIIENSVEQIKPSAPVTEETSNSSKPVKLVCPKHGDVTTSALYMTFKDGPDKVEQFLYCLPCLNELLLSMQKQGIIQQLQVEVLESETKGNDPA